MFGVGIVLKSSYTCCKLKLNYTTDLYHTNTNCPDEIDKLIVIIIKIIIILFAFQNLFYYHFTTYNIVHIQIGANKQVCRHYKTRQLLAPAAIN